MPQYFDSRSILAMPTSAEPPASQKTEGIERNTPEADGCLIQVIEGADAGTSYELLRGKAVVGSREGCQLRLSDPTVSGSHVEVEVRADGVLVTDLGSTNGTYYLETRLEKAVVQHGAVITVGHTRLRVSSCHPPHGVTFSNRSSYGALIGSAPAMQRLYSVLERIETVAFAVLITGDTGVGKELVAREIHGHSKRKEGPFEICDCAALPSTLAESELFGHARGSFTGATADHPGAFARADGGTLLLDEIGELPLDLQPKLLRALDRREIRPVGGTRFREVDVRVIAATHRDLSTLVTDGKFREDLYFRLQIVNVEVPALRKRREDIPLLVDSFLRELGQEELRPSQATLELFTTGYDWPGNVRELRNALSSVLTLGSWAAPPGDEVLHAPQERDPAVRYDATFHEEKQHLIEAFERDYLAAKLQENEGNIARTARAANLERNHLKHLLRKYGLLRDAERPAPRGKP